MKRQREPINRVTIIAINFKRYISKTHQKLLREVISAEGTVATSDYLWKDVAMKNNNCIEFSMPP
jgi:hypothetical protein